MSVRTVQRVDAGELRPSEKTDEGYLFVDAFIARPGIYLYSDGKGGTIRELISRKVLTDAKSLDTLKSRPVTNGHPSVDVSAENYREHAVGDVGDEWSIAPDGRPRFRLKIKDADTIRAVENGGSGVSPGYMAKVDFTGGVDEEFGPFDSEQVERFPYNHVAVNVNARGGTSVHLRADGASQGERVPDKRSDRKDSMTLEEAIAAGIVVLSKDFERVDAENKTLKADAADKDAQIASLTADKSTLQGKIDAAPSDEDVVKARLDWFGERAEIVAAADKVGIEADVIAKTDNAELRKAVVMKAKPDSRKDGDDAYFAAAFDFMKGDLSKPDGDGYAAFNMKNKDANNRKDGNRKDGEDTVANPGGSFWNRIDEAAGRQASA